MRPIQNTLKTNYPIASGQKPLARKLVSSLWHTSFVLSIATATLPLQTASAQDPEPNTQSPTEWNTAVTPQLQIPITDPTQNTPAAVPNSDADQTQPGELRLVALLSDNGQKIDRGLVWRVFEHHPSARTEPKLVSTKNTASPRLNLKPGKYVVNAAYGRAYLNKTLEIRSGAKTTETFVLNAGGLKLLSQVDGKVAPKNSVHYDIFEGEPDQSGERRSVIENARPNLIIRLNAGIYRIISRYGDANATVSADVQVEAGKLSVATVSHSAARVTFKLVERPGGEAIPGIQWSIATKKGETVLTSVGALPTHILAPGTYFVTAISATGTYKAEFAIEGGQLASVEVVMN